MKKAYGLRIFRATGIALHQPRDSSTMPRLIAFILAVAIAISVQATPTTPALNSRATDFAVEVAARDFRSARKGNQHVFSYTENETEEALSRSLREWLTRGETRNMRMALTDRLTLFAFYWAALQMPADSLCFSDIDEPGLRGRARILVSPGTRWQPGVHRRVPSGRTTAEVAAASHQKMRALSHQSIDSLLRRIPTSLYTAGPSATCTLDA